ncbi:MAG TPA: SigE family RNA polymerase sigma factor [Streptosporangiaceae bacterium]
MGRDDDGTGQPGRRPARDEVERLLAERGEHLMRAAIALTGSRPEGEDLLQAALERLLRHWGRIDSDPEGYLRRTLYNMAADGWRRRGAWLRKLPLVHAGSRHVRGTEAVEAVDLRDALGRALAQLPPRQRAVLVLRYWEELSQAETAELLGCAEGTVKSAAARGLQRLRELTAAWDDYRPQLTEKRS